MLILPLEMQVGTDFYLPLQWQFEICDNFYPIDITGYVFEMQVGLRPFSTVSPIIDITSLPGGTIIIDGPNGKAEFYIYKQTVTPYMFGAWQYAISATNTVGLTECLFGGEFNIKGWC